LRQKLSGCWCATDAAAHGIGEANFDTDPPYEPIGNSVARNKIPLASQTGQAFMVGNSNLMTGVCLALGISTPCEACVGIRIVH
jgi:hypothetical protein